MRPTSTSEQQLVKTTLPLFRKQCRPSVNTFELGEILVCRWLQLGWLTAAVVVLSVMALVLSLHIGLGRKLRCVGTVVPQTAAIPASSINPGSIKERYVIEGQRVAKGDVLFLITSDKEHPKAGSVIMQSIKLLQEKRDHLNQEMGWSEQLQFDRTQGLRQRAERLKLDRHRIDLQIQLQAQRLQLTEANASRCKDLFERGFISAAQLDGKTVEVLEQRQQMQGLVGGLSDNSHAIDQTLREMKELQWTAAAEQSALARSIADIERELSGLKADREWLVRAGVAGTVTKINADIGQTIAAPNDLAWLQPDDDGFEVEIFLDSKATGKVRSGSVAWLRYRAKPQTVYRATVKGISAIGQSPQQLRGSGAQHVPADGVESLFRIRLVPDQGPVERNSEPLGLRNGMSVDVTIDLDQRSLMQSLFAPQLGLTFGPIGNDSQRQG